MLRVLLAAILAGSWLACGAARAELPPDLVAKLRQGGYIIYMRHGPTDKSQRSVEKAHLAAGSFDLSDCATQRNLSPEGRRLLNLSGGAFRTLGVPVGRLLASRYCRTMETARLFAGEPEPADDLTPRPDTGEPGRADALRARLAEPPLPGTNTLIVAHGGIMMAVDGLQPNEGEALVFAPADAGRSHQQVARVKLAAWEPLAQDQ